MGHWLGRGLANLAAIIDPTMFVIGGGVSQAGDLLIPPARETLERTLTGRGYRPMPEVSLALLGPEAGLVGAADLARRRVYAVPVVRLLSYNVRSLRDDAAAVVRVIRSAEPHVVCIQEAPRLLRWRAKCAALARRSGLVVVTGGRTAGANLILSSLDVDVVGHRGRAVHQGAMPTPTGCGALAVLRMRGADVCRGWNAPRPGGRIAACGTLPSWIARWPDGAGRHADRRGRRHQRSCPDPPTWARLTEDRLDVWAAIGEGTASPTARRTRGAASTASSPVPAWSQSRRG